MIDWAPHGRWADAASVRSGDYSSFRYSVSYKPPTRASTTGLRKSPQVGLMGVPLPEGAKLIDRKNADPKSGRDPSERYSISSSAEDVRGFFLREIPLAGWKKDGSSQDFALFFQKGKLLIGVLISRDGKTFTLMGS